MTDTAAARGLAPLPKLALELGPLVVFFVTFNRLNAGEGEQTELTALLWATGAFMAALVLAMAITYALSRTVSRVALFTGAVVLVLGSLTLWLRDETFIKLRPTAVNAAFSIALWIGLWRGRSYLKLLIGELLPMTPLGWMKLTRNWAIFFACMACVNELVWRTQTTETWVWMKTFVYLPATILFTLSQTPMIARHALPDDGAKPEA